MRDILSLISLRPCNRVKALNTDQWWIGRLMMHATALCTRLFCSMPLLCLWISTVKNKGNLWVQCETLELRFLKCSIKWNVLTFCFSPVSASLLHSFYSLENTTLSLAYLVIMTEPYASHDAREIELLCSFSTIQGLRSCVNWEKCIVWAGTTHKSYWSRQLFIFLHFKEWVQFLSYAQAASRLRSKNGM
jgi:hypothetical protein